MRPAASIQRIVLNLIAIAGLHLLASPSRAGLVTTIDITVDTSAIAGGTAGNLFFSLNPGSGIADSLRATISRLAFTNLVYAANEVLDGDATSVANAGTGAVPNDYLLSNSTFQNDASFDVTFNTPPGGASRLSFEVALTGPAIDSPSQAADSTTDFSFQLSGPASQGYPALLGLSEVVHFSLLVGSNIPTITYQAAEATVLVTPPSDGIAVPEPSTILLAVAGVSSLLAARSRRIRFRANLEKTD